MEKTNYFIELLVSVLEHADKEHKRILEGETSQWSLNQIQDIIIPEVHELLSYAHKGIIYFKYGRAQRLLESSHLITDSLSDLFHTTLGESVIKLQEFFNSL